MYGVHSKLVCLSKRANVTDNYEKTPAYHVICSFSVDYEYVMFCEIVTSDRINNTIFTLI
jgi:hypothetical protein